MKPQQCSFYCQNVALSFLKTMVTKLRQNMASAKTNTIFISRRLKTTFLIIVVFVVQCSAVMHTMDLFLFFRRSAMKSTGFIPCFACFLVSTHVVTFVNAGIVDVFTFTGPPKDSTVHFLRKVSTCKKTG